MDMISLNSGDSDNKYDIIMRLINGKFQKIPSDLRNDHLDSDKLDNGEIARICEYLENPTNKGVWFLTSYWISEGGITSDIKNEIENYFIYDESIQNNEKKDSASKVRYRPFGNKEELLEEINKFSFIFSLFTYISSKETDDKKLQIFKNDFNKRDIIQSLNIERIKEQYKDAYEFFKNEIYFDSFNPSVYSNRVLKIKDGLILLNYKNKSGNISFSSLSYSPLEKINDFFTKIGKIKDCRIRPEYSPEETVFTPYFSFLEKAYPYFIHDLKVIELFQKTIIEYKDQNYEYCISTLGLIAENYLTQIYETFHRESIPKKLTLGQTYDLINNKINNQFQSKVVSAPNIQVIYEKLNNALSNKSEVDETKHNQDNLKLIREMLYFIQEDKKHTSYIINNLNKKESRISLFPENLKENINELIRLRNATSHNSRIPIGQYEAQRMVYCCITLIMWWKKEKDVIDWKDDQKTIIEKTIERNKSSSGEL